MRRLPFDPLNLLLLTVALALGTASVLVLGPRIRTALARDLRARSPARRGPPPPLNCAFGSAPLEPSASALPAQSEPPSTQPIHSTPDATRNPSPAHAALEGYLRVGDPLDLLIRLTPLCHRKGEPSGPSLSQQPDPEGRFRFTARPKGVYRFEVLWQGSPLGINASFGFGCGCAHFTGSARSAELDHNEEKGRWRIDLGLPLSLEVYDRETQEPLAGSSFGHEEEHAPGRITHWINLIADPRQLGRVSAPGYSRVSVPGGPFRRPVPPIKLYLEREFVLRIRLVDQAGRAVGKKGLLINVHQTEEPCGRSAEARGDCYDFQAHTWSLRPRETKDVILIRNLPPTQKPRRISVFWGRDGDTSLVVPGDQSEVTITID